MSRYPASGPVELKTNLADSALVKPLKSGEISTPLVHFDFCGPKTANNGFKAMVRDRGFAAGELAICTFAQAKAYGKPLVLLPATMVGRPQHHTIVYNRDRGTLTPKDLEGRKVGVRAYTQTTGVWVRGIPQHQYGVDLSKVTWVCNEDAHLAEFKDPPNVVRVSPDKPLAARLMDGEIDAAILGADMPDDPRIATLIPDPKAAQAAWYQQNGAMPINHLFAIDSDLSAERPDVVREIYRALQESKAKGLKKTVDPDPLPFGFSHLKKAIAIAIQYADEQGLLPRRVTVDECFDATTRALEA